MDLVVEIKQDADGTIAIYDYTRTSDSYVSEDSNPGLVSFDTFKYSQTCAIDIIKYQPSSGEELVDIVFSNHNLELESDSVKIPIKKDGYYTIDHIVLPTLEWLEEYKDQIETTPELYVYVSDGCNIYQYRDESLIQIDFNIITQCNPEISTLSIAKFDVFNITGIRNCYISLSKLLLKDCPSNCKEIEASSKFNRDFMWMLYNVLIFLIEDRKYIDAQITLERTQTCTGFCSDSNDITNSKSCGCNK